MILSYSLVVITFLSCSCVATDVNVDIDRGPDVGLFAVVEFDTGRISFIPLFEDLAGFEFSNVRHNFVSDLETQGGVSLTGQEPFTVIFMVQVFAKKRRSVIRVSHPSSTACQRSRP